MWLKGSGDTHMSVFCTKLGLAARPSREKPPYKIIYSEELHVNTYLQLAFHFFVALLPNQKYYYKLDLVYVTVHIAAHGKPLGS